MLDFGKGRLSVLGCPGDVPNDAKPTEPPKFRLDRLGACGHYRIKWPLDAIARRGFRTEWGVYLGSDLSHLITQFDVAVFQRQTQAGLREIIEDAREAGVVVVYDFDDNVLHVSDPDNYFGQLFFGNNRDLVWRAFLEFERKGMVDPRIPRSPDFVFQAAQMRRRQFVEMLGSVDCITVTVPYLKEVYAEHTDTRIEVLPNCIEPVEWDAEVVDIPGTEGKFIIGWSGSETHAADLKMIVQPLNSFMKRVPDAVLVLVGFPAAREFFPALLQERILTFPFMESSKYKGYVKAFDVALAPAVNSAFNKSKSSIRIWEAGMAGLPVIASPVPYGNDVHEFGFVAKNNSDWFRALKTVHENVAGWRKIGKLHQKHVLKDHTYDANIDKWISLYEELTS